MFKKIREYFSEVRQQLYLVNTNLLYVHVTLVSIRENFDRLIRDLPDVRVMMQTARIVVASQYEDGSPHTFMLKTVVHKGEQQTVGITAYNNFKHLSFKLESVNPNLVVIDAKVANVSSFSSEQHDAGVLCGELGSVMMGQKLSFCVLYLDR